MFRGGSGARRGERASERKSNIVVVVQAASVRVRRPLAWVCAMQYFKSIWPERTGPADVGSPGRSVGLGVRDLTRNLLSYKFMK